MKHWELTTCAIYESIRLTPGDFGQKVKSALNANLINSSETVFNQNTVGFRVGRSEQSVVMLIVEHDHQ